MSPLPNTASSDRGLVNSFISTSARGSFVDSSSSSGFELLDLKAAKSSRQKPPRISTNMSYQPLASDDPDEQKTYGSLNTTPNHSPTALTGLSSESFDVEDPTTNIDNPFLDSETAEYWREVYNNCQYECRHVFNPKLEWSATEERELIRKLDWRVCLWAVRNRSLFIADNDLPTDDLILSI